MPAHKKIQKADGRPVWADVSLSALSYNFHSIRDFVNPKSEKLAIPRKVLCLVKGNGYGHGGPEVAKALEKAGSDWFGVTGATEGQEIRKVGVRKPILALTSFWPGEEAQLLANKISPAIIRCEQLAALDSAAAKRKFGKRSIGFHLKIDSGMNRLGIALTDIECFARQYEKCSRLKLEGVFTHFASSEVFDGPGASQNRVSIKPSNVCAPWESIPVSFTLPTAQPSLRVRKPGQTWFAPAQFSTVTIQATIRSNAACKPKKNCRFVQS